MKIDKRALLAATGGFSVLAAAGFIIGAGPSTWPLGSPHGLSPIAASILIATGGAGLVSLVFPGDKLRSVRSVLRIGLVFRLLLASGRYLIERSSPNADSHFYRKQALELLEVMEVTGAWPDGGPGQYLAGPPGGNDWMSLVIAWLYNLFGTDMYTSHVLMSGLAFFGVVAFVRAAVEAGLDNKAAVTFAVLLSFLPSIGLWTATGKDALLFASLGFLVLAWFEYLNHNASAFAIGGAFFFGILGALIRPHVVLLVVGAAVVSLAASKTLHGGRRILAIGVGFVGLIVLVSTARGLVGGATITDAITAASTRTAFDDAVIVPSNPLTPIGFFQSALTVYLRPFLWEATHIFSLFSAVEGVFVGYFVVSIWRNRRSVVDTIGLGKVGFLTSYLTVSVFLFGTVANLGVIARQRTQLTPMLFLMFAVAWTSRNTRASSAEGRIGHPTHEHVPNELYSQA